MKNREVLLDASYKARENPLFQPRDGMTFCNEAVQYIAGRMGNNDLNGRLANEIIDFMSASSDYSVIEVDQAQFSASLGSLVIAGEKADPHGHVVVLIPGIEQTSGRWGKVPTCINIGKDVWIGKGINWAFQDIPKFFVWRPSL